MFPCYIAYIPCYNRNRWMNIYIYIFYLYIQFNYSISIQFNSVQLQFNSVQFSCSVLSDSMQPHGLQLARLPYPSPTPGAYSNSCPLSRCCRSTSHPLLSPSPPIFNLSQHQGLFKWVSSLIQVAKVLEFQLQHQSFQWTPRTDLL